MEIYHLLYIAWGNNFLKKSPNPKRIEIGTRKIEGQFKLKSRTVVFKYSLQHYRFEVNLFQQSF